MPDPSSSANLARPSSCLLSASSFWCSFLLCTASLSTSLPSFLSLPFLDPTTVATAPPPAFLSLPLTADPDFPLVSFCSRKKNVISCVVLRPDESVVPLSNPATTVSMTWSAYVFFLSVGSSRSANERARENVMFSLTVREHFGPMV